MNMLTAEIGTSLETVNHAAANSAALVLIGYPLESGPPVYTADTSFAQRQSLWAQSFSVDAVPSELAMSIVGIIKLD